jgi:hypothetical protein
MLVDEAVFLFVLDRGLRETGQPFSSTPHEAIL